ncbi:hypothetical protein BD311DRAFT_766009 [Dichomitus squalens]|uniref:Uncharacterized protein n=1 Tax=Dichomitus squalens TaxID=114155 RepID=A0A4Q9MFQ2_9APHY|nr:hypothetical protein BD311DRAFT_766009 [Dichomitus squalens]
MLQSGCLLRYRAGEDGATHGECALGTLTRCRPTTGALRWIRPLPAAKYKRGRDSRLGEGGVTLFGGDVEWQGRLAEGAWDQAGAGWTADEAQAGTRRRPRSGGAGKCAWGAGSKRRE